MSLNWCVRKKLKVNAGKSKLMRYTRETVGKINVRLNKEELEEVDCFKYLWLIVAVNGELSCKDNG